MSNPEWGAKRICPETGKRFYDLNKSPIVSPYTGNIVAVDSNDRRDESLVTAAKSKSASAKADDDDLLVDDDDAVEVDDELLENDDEDTVALDDLADVASDKED